MFGSIGFQEMLIILMVALLVFGPKKLPEVGRTIGKAIREFKRSTEEIKGKFEEQVRAEEFKSIRTDIQDIQRNLDVRTQLSDLAKDIDVTRGAAEDGEAKKES